MWCSTRVQTLVVEHVVVQHKRSDIGGERRLETASSEDGVVTAWGSQWRVDPGPRRTSVGASGSSCGATL